MLNSADNWRLWYNQIRQVAEREGVWRYFDQSRAEMPVPQEPIKPSVSDVSEMAFSLRDLDAEGRETWKMLLTDYRIDDEKYERTKRSIIKVGDLISSTIPANFKARLVGKHTGYQELATLEGILAPTDSQHRQLLRTQYAATMKPPRALEHKDLQTWLNNWVSIYEECREVGLPRALDMRETFTDLIQAIGQVSPDYQTFQAYSNGNKEDDDLPQPAAVISDFLKSLSVTDKRTTSSSGRITHATLQGHEQHAQNEQHGENEEEKKFNNKKLVCLRGQEHKFENCPYVNEKLRSEGWSPNPEVEEKFQNAYKNKTTQECIE